MNNFYKVWNRVAPYYDRWVTKTQNRLLTEYQTIEEKHLFHLIKSSLLKDDISIVEIGCGTGRLFFQIIKNKLDENISNEIKFSIGIDISRNMIQAAIKNFQDANKHIINKWENKMIFFNIDARNASKGLMKRMDKNAYLEFLGTRKIVVCMLNTLGIIYPADRINIINEMAKIAGKDGKIFISVFNAELFEKKANGIYKSLTGIVGKFNNNTVFDIKNHDFKNKDYYSHWFLENEIMNLVHNGLSKTNIRYSNMVAKKINSIGIIVHN